MKRILFSLSLFCFAAYAENYDSLLKKADADTENAIEEMTNAQTQVEINAASGNYFDSCLKKAELVWDELYRKTTDREMRKLLRHEFAGMMMNINQNFIDARDDKGSASGMMRASRAAVMAGQMTELWQADKESAARWRRIADAYGEVNNCNISISGGICTVKTTAYDNKTDLEVIICPANCFSFNGVDYIVAQADIACRMCDDYMNAIILAVKDNLVIKCRQTEYEYILKDFKVDKNILTLIGEDGKTREFDLTRL